MQRRRPNRVSQAASPRQKQERSRPDGVSGELERAVPSEKVLLQDDVNSPGERRAQDEQRLRSKAQPVAFPAGNQGHTAEAQQHTTPSGEREPLVEREH